MSSIRVNPEARRITTDGVYLPMTGLLDGFVTLTNGILWPTNEYGKSENLSAFVDTFLDVILTVVMLSPILPRFLRPS